MMSSFEALNKNVDQPIEKSINFQKLEFELQTPNATTNQKEPKSNGSLNWLGRIPNMSHFWLVR